MNMEHCHGITDWYRCTRCEHLCTRRCPLENEDVMKALGRRLTGAESEHVRDHIGN